MNSPRDNTILIVEDEKNLARLLSDYLRASGYEAHSIANGLEVIDWVKKNHPALILLDLMLPGQDGISLCKAIRQFSNLPIIITTAKVDEIDRLLGLELGADDYICKPYSPREVVARVKAVLRRVAARAAPFVHDFELDKDSHIARLAGTNLNLTAIEFRLLAALLGQPGRVFSRDHLLDVIYTDGRVVSDRTVDSHVKNLRKKVQQVVPDTDVIRSIYGLGYTLEL